MRHRRAVVLTAFLTAVLLLMAAVIAGGCGSGKKEHFTYKKQMDEKQLAVYSTFEAAAAGGGNESGGYYFLEPGGSKDGKISVSEHTALCAFQAYLYDHPEITLLERSFSYRKEDDTEDALIEAVRPEYYTIPGLDEIKAQDRLSAAASEMIGRIPGQASDTEKAESLYNILTQEVSYCEEALYNLSLKTEHTAYGALVNKSAVCDGIALAYVYLLRECDIPCAAVPGQAGGMSHVWVVLYTEGRWTEADPTWGILKGSRYFGLTTAEMNTDHERDYEGLGRLAPVSEQRTH